MEITLSPDAIRINEIMTSNKGAVADSDGRHPDWIELYNSGDEEFSIAGYGLSDNVLDGVKYVFPQGTKIAPNGYLIIFCSGDATSILHTPFKLSSSESIVLFDNTGKILNSVDLTAVTSGMTYALNSAGMYVEMRPSPGFENSEAGIKEYGDSLYAEEIVGLYINEFMAKNIATQVTDQFQSADWIELYNSTNDIMDISGFGISDTLSQPMKATVPEGTTILPHSYCLILCSGNTPPEPFNGICVPFSLDSTSGYVSISDKAGRIIDSYSYAEQEPDVSMARSIDGIGDFEYCYQATPGYPNTTEGYNEYMKQNSAGINARSEIYISEIVAKNSSSFAYTDGQYYDWIELFNASSDTIDLSKYYLTDNSNNPSKWNFPETTILPNEYLVVYASGLTISNATDKSSLHLNFSLSEAGETIYLANSSGNFVDKLSYNSLPENMSFGRDANGTNCYFTTPTPASANSKGYLGFTSTVQFSNNPGIYGSSVSISLYANSDEKIYYTTDCTVPTELSQEYSTPIVLSKNTVIRAIAVKQNYLSSAATAGTYLFKDNDVNHSLPIVCLTTSPDNLWDAKTGIYATGDQFDPDLDYGDTLLTATYYQSKLTGDTAFWERPASFELFSSEGDRLFMQNVGVRIAGSYGRGRAQKGFNIIARSEYGADRMEYAFFDNREYCEYKALVLRAGAQDQNRSKIRDELATGLLEDTDVRVLHQAYSPYILYLNGEYWGVYFLKEKRNRFFVAQHENTNNTDDMDILHASTKVNYGTNEEWIRLIEYVKTHDLSIQSNYNYVLEHIDVESFMDYMICEIYVGNTDHANNQFYKLPDGKWKWIYYDFCWGFGDVTHNTLAYRRGVEPAGSILFNGLLQNAEWRDAFIRRFANIMNSVYSSTRVNAKIDELYSIVEPEIRREREKFCSSTFMDVAQPDENLGSYDTFINEIGKLHKWADLRPKYMRQYIKDEFNLSDQYMLEVFGVLE